MFNNYYKWLNRYIFITSLDYDHIHKLSGNILNPGHVSTRFALSPVQSRLSYVLLAAGYDDL